MTVDSTAAQHEQTELKSPLDSGFHETPIFALKTQLAIPGQQASSTMPETVMFMGQPVALSQTMGHEPPVAAILPATLHNMAVLLGRAGGRIGGRVRSAAKLAACRRNVRLAQAARKRNAAARRLANKSKKKQ